MRKLILITLAVAGVFLVSAQAWGQDYPATSGTLLVTKDGQPISTVQPGESVHVSGSGFAPGTTVQVTIESTPTLLTTANASPNGRLSATVTIPTDISSGRHTLKATGVAATTGTMTLSAEVTVARQSAAASSSGGLAFTGGNVLPLVAIAVLALGVGTLLVTVTRRRSRRTA